MCTPAIPTSTEASAPSTRHRSVNRTWNSCQRHERRTAWKDRRGGARRIRWAPACTSSATRSKRTCSWWEPRLAGIWGGRSPVMTPGERSTARGARSRSRDHLVERRQVVAGQRLHCDRTLRRVARQLVGVRKFRSAGWSAARAGLAASILRKRLQRRRTQGHDHRRTGDDETNGEAAPHPKHRSGILATSGSADKAIGEGCGWSQDSRCGGGRPSQQ